MLVSDFDYGLPPELIAQRPPADRAGARMLRLVRGFAHDGGPDACAAERREPSPASAEVTNVGPAECALARKTGLQPTMEDREFRELPAILRPGDLVVMNNTRVFPARLLGHRSGARAQPVGLHDPAAHTHLTGRVEVLLTRQLSSFPNDWLALVRPGRKIGVGERLFFQAKNASSGSAPILQAEVVGRGEFGERRLRFAESDDFFAAVERAGHVPLPPYIARHYGGDDEPADSERYQTVFARERGSVAAPTAGLHFTPEIIATLHQRGIHTAEITLHVGLGTFQPVHAERIEDHHMHAERYAISAAAAAAVGSARREKRRIVAVGTTTVRTLEYAALQSAGGEIKAHSGEADLFIYPGFRFQAVNAMLTNFHLPRSTLLMLVSAFAGREAILRAYEHAVRERYRFFSYGDCMLIE